MLGLRHRQYGFLRQKLPIVLISIAGAAIIGAIVYQKLIQYKDQALYIRAETKINKLGDDITSEYKLSKFRKDAQCYYLSAKFERGARVCDMDYKILFENTTEAQAIQIFEKAVAKAQRMYSVRSWGADHTSALRMVLLEEKMPIFCDMTIEFWTKEIPSYADSKSNWVAPTNASLLTIHCGGSAKAEHFKVVGH